MGVGTRWVRGGRLGCLAGCGGRRRPGEGRGGGGHEGAARGLGGESGLSFPPKPGGGALPMSSPPSPLSQPFRSLWGWGGGGMSDLGALSGALHLDLIVLSCSSLFERR